MKRILSTLVLTGAIVAAMAVPHEAKADTRIFFGFGTPAPVVYSQPRVVYMQPQPVFYRPAPVYYPPVQQVVYRPGWDRRDWDRRHWDNHRDHDRDHWDHR